MRFEHLQNEDIQILDSKADVWSTIRDITSSDKTEEDFYICNMADIARKHFNWMKLMPRIHTHYAVKCNDHHLVLETLDALGTGFDCASEKEIAKILSMGVKPDRIIFANPTKPETHIKYAASNGVEYMTFDNGLELEKIKRSHPSAKMVLRIRYDDVTARFQLGKKFGCNAETEAAELLDKALSLGIDVVGVSFHVGSASTNPDVYSGAIKASRHVFNIAADMGFKFHLLDIGGGYPGAHGTDIIKISETINDALAQYFPDPSVKIIAEPGRYYVDSAFTLVTRIHSIATSEADPITGIKTYMYYVNTGIYNSLINIILDEDYHPKPLKKREGAKVHPSILWGPTCDCFDKICENIELPEMQIGDWIVFENAGAYTLSISSNFNGFPIPHVHGVADEETWSHLKNFMPIRKEKHINGIPIETLNRLDKKYLLRRLSNGE